MNCEQHCYKSASPQMASHLRQHQKQKDDSDRVQKHVGEMMPGRIESVQLAIQHVRNRRQRVPVTGYRMRKGPGDPRWRNAGGDIGIHVNVLWVVIRNKLMSQSLTENQTGYRGKNSTNDDNC